MSPTRVVGSGRMRQMGRYMYPHPIHEGDTSTRSSKASARWAAPSRDISGRSATPSLVSSSLSRSSGSPHTPSSLLQRYSPTVASTEHLHPHRVLHQMHSTKQFRLCPLATVSYDIPFRHPLPFHTTCRRGYTCSDFLGRSH